VLLAGGFALGVVLMSAQKGFTRDLTAYLVGSILTVQVSDITVSAVTAVVVLTVLVALRKELLLGAFDPDALTAAGYPTRRLDFVILLTIEVTVVTSVPAVGTILAVALIVGPAATAKMCCSSVGSMTAVAVVVAVASGVAGVVASELWRVAAGGATVLAVAAFFTVSLLLAPPVNARLQRRRSQSSRSDAQPPQPQLPTSLATTTTAA
jgi:manganese/iron transport system permease protein